MARQNLETIWWLIMRIKSAGHHWWPRCVSAHWAGEDGGTGWLSPDGSCKRLRPDHLGVIGNGHHVKLGSSPDGEEVFEYSFEDVFNDADSYFPDIITWLEELEHDDLTNASRRGQLIAQEASDEQLCKLTECVVSLAVRSPRSREHAVSVAEHFRGSIASSERNVLIGLNIQHRQRSISDSIGSRAKFVVCLSRDKEFVFGDGFFHNLTSANLYLPKVFVPITPTISVGIVRPMQYREQPKLQTIVLTDAEVEQCNHAIQVYSRQAIFFRSQRPIVHENFECAQHRVFSSSDNPIDRFFGWLALNGHMPIR